MLAVSAKPDASQYSNSYQGKFRDNINSWLAKARYNAASEKITLVEPQSRSLLIYKEQVQSILEVSEGKLLIAVYNLDILLTTDYSVTRRVVDPDSGNINKYQPVAFPG